MKIFKAVLLFFVFFILAGFIALVIFLKTFDSNAYLTKYTKQISQSLSRDLSIGKADLSLSFSQGVHLRLKDVSLADDREFSDDFFIEAKKIEVGINLWALLFDKTISASAAVVQSPRVQIIRNEGGDFNFNSLAFSSNSSSEDTENSSLLPALFVRSLLLDNGEFIFKDLASETVSQISSHQIDLHLRDFSLLDPFAFELSLALFNKQQNMFLKGSGRFDLANQIIRLDDSVFDLNLSSIDFQEVLQSAPGVADYVGINELQGNLKFDILQCILGVKEGIIFKAEGGVSDGKVVIAQMASPLDNLNLKAQLTRDQIFLHDLSFNLASGDTKFKGVVHNYIYSPSFDVQVDLKAIDFSELEFINDFLDKKIPFEGKIDGNVVIKSDGVDKKRLLSTLESVGTVNISDGRLQNINLLKRVINQLSNVPEIDLDLSNQLPKKWRDVMSQSDTHFDQLSIEWQLSDEKIHFADLALASEGVKCTKSGTFGFDKSVEASGTLELEKEIVDDLVKKNEVLSVLKNKQGLISVPFWVKGILPKPDWGVDRNYLANKMADIAINVVTEKLLEKQPEAKQVLDALFGGNLNGVVSKEKDVKKKDSANDLIGNVLQQLF